MIEALKLSVAMCTYNGAAYLPAQLQSIAAQTRPPDELVVCDDCSTDASAQIVAAFAAGSPFPVRLYINERNLGSTANFEQAIGLCAGDIIALADQDDVWLGEKLARLEAVLAGSPDVGLVFSDAELVDAALQPLGRRLWATVGGDEARRKLRRRTSAFNLLLAGWTVTGATMAFRAEHRSLVLPIPLDIAMIHDGWIALLVGAVARVCLIEEPLLLYRQHAAQQIGAQVKAEADTSVRSALSRATSYAEGLLIIERARERLLLKGGSAAASAVRNLEAARRHFNMRARLPAARLRRLPLVLRELLTLRYHCYGKGLSSAAKDFLL